jgi:hypothetical protein
MNKSGIARIILRGTYAEPEILRAAHLTNRTAWERICLETHYQALPIPPEDKPEWACGAAGSALPWHGRGRRFDPDQVHQFFNNHLRQLLPELAVRSGNISVAGIRFPSV